jgi:hypothetical protein
MDKLDPSDPESPVRIIPGGGEPGEGDMDLAWAWLRGTLACLATSTCGYAEVEKQLQAAPALAVLMSYRRAVQEAGALPEA